MSDPNWPIYRCRSCRTEIGESEAEPMLECVDADDLECSACVPCPLCYRDVKSKKHPPLCDACSGAAQVAGRNMADARRYPDPDRWPSGERKAFT